MPTWPTKAVTRGEVSGAATAEVQWMTATTNTKTAWGHILGLVDYTALEPLPKSFSRFRVKLDDAIGRTDVDGT